MCDTGQVNNAAILGTIISDPDALRSIFVDFEVSFHVLFFGGFKQLDVAITSRATLQF